MAYLQNQLALLNLDTELDCYVSNGVTNFVGNRDTRTHIHSAYMGANSVTSFGLMNLAGTYKSSGGVAVPVVFKNDSSETVELMWYNYSGELVSYGKIAPGGTLAMGTYASHPWTIKSSTRSFAIGGEEVWVPTANDKGRTVHIEKLAHPRRGPAPVVHCAPKEDLMNLKMFTHKKQNKNLVLLLL